MGKSSLRTENSSSRLLKIDQLQRARQLSDVEIISKLPTILKGQASTWYTLKEKQMANASWKDWKQLIVDKAQNQAWRTYMVNKRERLSFPGSIPPGESRGGQWFIYGLYNSL